MSSVAIRRELCLTLLLWIRRSGRSLNAHAAPSNSVMLSCGLLPRNSFAPLRCKDWQLVVLIAIFPTNSRNLEREKPLKNASNRIGKVMWKITSFLWKLHFSDLLHSRNYFPLMYENSKLRVCIFEPKTVTFWDYLDNLKSPQLNAKSLFKAFYILLVTKLKSWLFFVCAEADQNHIWGM